MGSFANGMVDVATKLINKYGSDIDLIDTVKGAYDPLTGDTAISTVEHKIKGVVENYTLQELKSEYVNTNDLKLTVVMDKVITKDWLVLYKNISYKIVSVGRENAQNTDIIYYLQIRA